MTDCPFSDIVFEALCMREIYRRLDFQPDEIYFRPMNENIFMTVRRAGLELNYDLGPHGRNQPSLAAEWTEASRWWNEFPDAAALKQTFERSKVRLDVVGIILALHRKGFRLTTGSSTEVA